MNVPLLGSGGGETLKKEGDGLSDNKSKEKKGGEKLVKKDEKVVSRDGLKREEQNGQKYDISSVVPEEDESELIKEVEIEDETQANYLKSRNWDEEEVKAMRQAD